MPTIQTKRTACPRDCPDACGLIATIEDGVVVRLQGDPDHPITQGYICQRTSRYPDLQNAAHRLKRPLYRKSTLDEFAEIDWDTAFDIVTERMRTIREESGPAAVFHHRCGGSMGMMKHVGDHFFERFGPVTVKSGDVCCGAGEAAQLEDFGEFDSSDFFDLHNAKTIVLWGKNVFVSSIHLIPELKKARAAGTKIILIDPVHHQTTQLADVYIQPAPGSDAAIACGIARWLFENNKADSTAAEYCDHVDEYRELVFSKSFDDWAGAAGIASSELAELAALFADGPTMSMIGWGLQRRRHGAATVRAIDALVAVSGNLGIAGGGASFYFVRRDAFDFSFSDGYEAPRSIPEPLFGPAILEASDPPIRMAWVWAANPVAMLPDSEMVARALRTREFTVVVDPFLTDTAKCAHLVLPTTTFLEEDDFIGAYGHHYLAEVNPVVEAPAEVRTDHEIFRELARRLDLGADFDVDASVWKDRLLTKLKAAGISAEDFSAGAVRNPFVKPILFADRKFNTPSGKVNLIHSLHEDLLQPPRDRSPKVTAVSTRKSQGSQWMPTVQEGPQAVTLNSAAAAGFHDGDVVAVVTEQGRIPVKLNIDDRQRDDVLLFEKGGWHLANRSPNSLVAAECTDDGECAVYYDTPARLESIAD